MFKLFLSYRRNDSIDITGRIADRLKSRYGENSIFMDIYSIPVGVNFRDHINQEVMSSQILLPIIGTHWLDCRDEKGQRRLDNEDDFVRLEIESALHNKIPIVPILVGDASMPKIESLPISLAELPLVNATEIRSGIDFEDHITRLFKILDNIKSSIENPEKSIKNSERPKPVSAWLPFMVTTIAMISTFYYIENNKSIDIIEQQDSLKNGGLGPELIYLKKSSFRMGDLQGDGTLYEKPIHTVTFKQGFSIGKYEVTVKQFANFVEKTGYITYAESNEGCQIWTGQDIQVSQKYNWRSPGYIQSSELPVTCVNYNDAIAYTNWLTIQTGKDYALPTESQWEYAARAGNESRFSWGNELDNNTRAAYNLNQPTSIGTYAANQFGIFNMHGNMSEWVLDSWHPNYNQATKDGSAFIKTDSQEAVVRGGSWISPSTTTLRSAKRDGINKKQPSNIIGFRVVRNESNLF